MDKLLFLRFWQQFSFYKEQRFVFAECNEGKKGPDRFHEFVNIGDLEKSTFENIKKDPKFKRYFENLCKYGLGDFQKEIKEKHPNLEDQVGEEYEKLRRDLMTDTEKCKDKGGTDYWYAKRKSEKPWQKILSQAFYNVTSPLIEKEAAEASKKAREDLQSQLPNFEILKSGDLTRIYNYPENSAEIPENAKKQLDIIAGQLKADPNSTVDVRGFTDILGKGENFEWAQKRADAIAEYLIKQGVDKDRINVVGENKKAVKKSQKSSSELARDRKVEIEIINPTEWAAPTKEVPKAEAPTKDTQLSPSTEAPSTEPQQKPAPAEAPIASPPPPEAASETPLDAINKHVENIKQELDKIYSSEAEILILYDPPTKDAKVGRGFKLYKFNPENGEYDKEKPLAWFKFYNDGENKTNIKTPSTQIELPKSWFLSKNEILGSLEEDESTKPFKLSERLENLDEVAGLTNKIPGFSCDGTSQNFETKNGGKEGVKIESKDGTTWSMYVYQDGESFRLVDPITKGESSPINSELDLRIEIGIFLSQRPNAVFKGSELSPEQIAVYQSFSREYSSKLREFQNKNKLNQRDVSLVLGFTGYYFDETLEKINFEEEEYDEKNISKAIVKFDNTTESEAYGGYIGENESNVQRGRQRALFNALKKASKSGDALTVQESEIEGKKKEVEAVIKAKKELSPSSPPTDKPTSEPPKQPEKAQVTPPGQPAPDSKPAPQPQIVDESKKAPDAQKSTTKKETTPPEPDKKAAEARNKAIEEAFKYNPKLEKEFRKRDKEILSLEFRAELSKTLGKKVEVGRDTNPDKFNTYYIFNVENPNKPLPLAVFLIYSKEGKNFLSIKAKSNFESEIPQGMNWKEFLQNQLILNILGTQSLDIKGLDIKVIGGFTIGNVIERGNENLFTLFKDDKAVGFISQNKNDPNDIKILGQNQEEIAHITGKNKEESTKALNSELNAFSKRIESQRAEEKNFQNFGLKGSEEQPFTTEDFKNPELQTQFTNLDSEFSTSSSKIQTELSDKKKYPIANLQFKTLQTPSYKKILKIEKNNETFANIIYYFDKQGNRHEEVHWRKESGETGRIDLMFLNWKTNFTDNDQELLEKFKTDLAFLVQ